MSTLHIGAGVWPSAELPAAAVIDVAQRAESRGLHSIWLSEAYYGRDAVTLAAALAMATERITIATGVVNPYTRHPALLAMTFATLAELAPDRMVFGLGSSEPNWMIDLGYDFSKPRTAVLETIDVYEQLLARKEVTYAGKTTQVRSARLMFRPVDTPPPVVLAAVGPRMCALAKERAAGVLLSVGGSELPRVVRGRLGDVPDEFIVGMTIPLAVDDDRSAARSRVRPTIAALVAVPEGEAILEMSGFDPQLAADLRAAIETDGFRSGIGSLPDEVIDALTITGTRTECIDRAHEFIECGVNLPILLVGKHGTDEALEVLTELQRSAQGADGAAAGSTRDTQEG